MTKPNHQAEHIIQTGIQLFVKNGYLATSLDQLSKEAKVSKGLIIYHFGSLEGLLHQIIRRIGLALFHWLSQAKKETSATKKFQTLVTQWAHMIKSDTTLWQLFLILLSHQETANIIHPLVIAPFRESYNPFLSDISRELGYPQAESFIFMFDTFRLGLIPSFSKSKDEKLLDQSVQLLFSSLNQLS